MTISELLRKTDLPALDKELLLAFVLRKDRVFILSQPDFNIADNKIKIFLKLVKKRRGHWPLAYLIGEKGFYDLILKVNKKVLIPRPETEFMVNYFSKELNKYQSLLSKKKGTKKVQFIDLGTGSGAIIIALAKNLRDSASPVFKNINFWGLDIKSPALKIALLNAQQYQLDKTIKFLKSDLLKSLPKKHLVKAHLVIAANLPYLTASEIKAEKSLTHEPRSALLAGRDGLKYYDRLLKNLNTVSFESLTLLMEINPWQKINMQKLIKKYLPHSQITLQKDLSGQVRFILLKSA